jgi:hypothetical protein
MVSIPNDERATDTIATVNVVFDLMKEYGVTVFQRFGFIHVVNFCVYSKSSD